MLHVFYLNAWSAPKKSLKCLIMLISTDRHFNFLLILMIKNLRGKIKMYTG